MLNYAKGSTEQTVNAGIQEAGRGNHAAGATELAIERRSRGSKGRPPKQLPKETEEDLLAEVQRLRAENDYLKTCNPWLWKTSDAGTKSAGSSEAEAKTRTQYSALNRSTAPCNFLLSFETDT